jgi:broad specificity phosphatase PhoE
VANNTLAGRESGVHLNADGEVQIESLAPFLARQELRHIYCGPLERTRESAEIIGKTLGTNVSPVEEFTELELGDWTGRSVEELKLVSGWQEYNKLRSCTRIPNGETMVEIQARVLTGMLEVRTRHAGECIAIVSHADVVKLAIVHFAGMPIDLMHRLTIDPGSVSSVTMGDDFLKINFVNMRPDLN